MIAPRASPDNGQLRVAPRTRLFLSALIRFGHVSAPIQLRDLSPDGVRIEGKCLPDVGTVATISRGALHASGTVKWRDPHSCGLRFDSPLQLDDWMPNRVTEMEPALDQSVGDDLSGDGEPTPATLAEPQTLGEALPQRLAEELAYVSRILESLGNDLSNEPMIVVRHAVKLQNLDLAMQILGHVAALLVAPDPEDAVDSIDMVALRKRLRRAAL